MKSAFCFATLLALGWVTLPGARAQIVPARPSTKRMRCSNFEWASDENSPKAVIRVPISIDGQHYWYQLDTGADVVIAYGKGVHQGWLAKTDFSEVRHVEFAGMSISAMPVFRMKDESDKDLQGTVGLDLLVGRTFIIDFPEKRVCLLNRGELPDQLDQAASWTAAEIRNGKLFVQGLVLDGKPLSNVIYDSGTSPDELAVDFPLWKKATGRQSAADATSHNYAQTWGKKIEYVGARATGALILGKHTYPNPMLSACPSRPTNFHDNVHGAIGALGNALFFNSIVILDLGSHPQFGVVSPSGK